MRGVAESDARQNRGRNDTMKTTMLAAALLSGTPATPLVAQNAQHDGFMAMSASEQRRVLTYAIASAGYACSVTEHTFKGLYRRNAYHLAVCANGAAYLLTIPFDPQAEMVVLDCEIAAAVGADCCAEWE
jgi:nitrate reductase gamma subunit